MVDITIGIIPSVQSNQHNGGKDQRPLPKKKKKPNGRERRNNKTDRRQNVRDGYVVTLSTQSDRRHAPDRRKN